MCVTFYHYGITDQQPTKYAFSVKPRETDLRCTTTATW